MKQKYLLFMSYIGSRYRGAARQIKSNKLIDLDSVEGAIEAGFSTAALPHSLCFPRVRISSRTDAGVHALLNAAELVLEHPDNEFYNPNIILPRINLWLARCGHEIRLINLFPVDDTFSYRKANSRTYFYRFLIAKEYGQHKLPIVEYGRSWHVRGENIDLEALNNALRLFKGKKNYASFSPKNKTNQNINYVKELKHISLDPGHPLMPEDPLSNNFNFWNITIQSRSFVYNQIRRMIGCLIAIASGNLTEKDVKTILHCPSHLNWPSDYCVAPSQGLYLKTVDYDKELLNKHILKVEPNSVKLPVEKISASLLQNKKKKLKPTKILLTNVIGEKFEISDGVTTKLEVKVAPFVIDTKPNLQVDSILPGLFLSSQDPVFYLDILKSYAIKHILSLGIEPDVKFDGIQYHFIEILDIPEFNLITSLKECLKIIHQFRKDNILVHCNAGVSRSPTVVISYIMATQKLSYEEAFQKVKDLRTFIRPNDGFIQQLKDLKPEDLGSNIVDNIL